MEMTPSSSRPPERENHPSPANSPHSNGSSTSSSNGSSLHLSTPTPPHTPTPKSAITRSHADGSPYPTTFVQADTTTFKQVVQMLTGASDAAKHGPHRPDPSSARGGGGGGGGGIPPIKSTGQKKQGFKLYERRNSLKNGLMTINTFSPAAGLAAHSSASPRKLPEILSPSILDFPALVLSPITPMNEDAAAAADQEERAIAEKKFYFHPSPRATTPRDAAPPQLLPLFPVTSPRVPSGSSS